MKKIAIIGAGMSGITLAHFLKDFVDITVFEKSRGIGGRLSTRYCEKFSYDHGAQFFTARDKRFKKFLAPYIEKNIVEEWSPKTITMDHGVKDYKRLWFEPHYVPCPKMNSLLKVMSQNICIQFQSKVEGLQPSPKGWDLMPDSGEAFGPFDWVVSTSPALQTTSILPECFSGHALLKKVNIAPCYSLMLGFENPLPLNFQVAEPQNSPIGWIAVNGSKPKRIQQFSLIIHSTQQWALENIDTSHAEVQEILLTELRSLLKEIDVSTPEKIMLHLWRYAKTSNSLGEPFIVDEKNKLAACGDWCTGCRVEDAFLSACNLAQFMKEAL